LGHRQDSPETVELQSPGREGHRYLNHFRYSVDFFILLESWEAARVFWAHARAQKLEAIEIAVLLGWTCPDEDKQRINASTGRVHAVMQREAVDRAERLPAALRADLATNNKAASRTSWAKCVHRGAILPEFSVQEATASASAYNQTKRDGWLLATIVRAQPF
jgi:hypothetical protein